MRIHDSFRMRRWVLLAGTLAVAGCFTPDRGDEFEEPDDDGSADDGSLEQDSSMEPGEEDEAPACTELEETCEVNGDCPCFDGSTDVGTALCLSDGEQGMCSSICQQDSDCGTGCCAALEGDVEYGACAPSYVCEGEGGGSSASDQCVDGVAFFCACAASAGVECSSDELEAFVSTCFDPGHDLYDVFECWGGFSDGGPGACGDGLDACEI